MDLDASDEQLDCPFVYASAKAGHAILDLTDNPENMIPLFETIIDYIPAPEGDPDADTQVLISTIDYNEYVGRIGVGKVDNGTIAVNQEVMLVNAHEPDKHKRVKISKLYEFDGLNKVEVKEATIGSIVAISGNRRHPYRRHFMFPGKSGCNSFPENFRTDNRYAVYCK